MTTNSSFTGEPAELDADDAVERVLLFTPSGRRELAFFPESNNGHYWRIVELIGSENAAAPRREVVRFLDLEKNAVLPLSTLQVSGRNDWNVVVVYDKGQRDYPLLNQEEASKFQKLTTGYETSERYEGVTCGIIIKSTTRSRLSLKVRHEKDEGVGEIQLWEWPRTLGASNQPRSLRTGSMPISQRAGSITSTVQTLSGNRGGTSLQTTGGRELLLSSITPPPVLAFFMQVGGLYKMMKADSRLNLQSSTAYGAIMTRIVTDLEFRLSESRLVLFTASGTFSLERLSVENLEQWNLCAMRPTIENPATEKRKCTYLSLQFQSPGLAGDFVNALLRLQLSQKMLEADRAGVQRPLYNGPSKTSLRAIPPTSPGTETSSSSNFTSLPRISCMEPLDDPLWRVTSDPQQVAGPRRESITEPQIPELETERRVQEIRGTELYGMVELPHQ